MDERKNVLVIGSGGREHALTLRLSSSSKVSHVFVSPGNAGTAVLSDVTNVGESDHRNAFKSDI